MAQRQCLFIVFSMMMTAGLVVADDGPPAGPSRDAQAPGSSQPTPATAKGGTAPQEKTQPTKSIDALLEAIERQTREINALKEQYAREMQQQQKRAELQQKQIEILQRTAGLLTEQVRTQEGAGSSKEAMEKLEAKTDLLESRAQQAAQRDEELKQLGGDLIEQLDAERRNGPQLPAMLKGLFVPTPQNVSPLTIVNTLVMRYDLYPSRAGRGLLNSRSIPLSSWCR